MTDPNTQPTITNDILRLLIREAVERETATVIAPLRTQVQVQDGMLKQFNRDVLIFGEKVNDLDELVRGNPKQNLVGLADQLKQQSELINRLHGTITTSVESVQTVLSGEIKGLKTNQETAAKEREAIINQWRGAKYALSALAIVTGLANYEAIAKLFSLFNP